MVQPFTWRVFISLWFFSSLRSRHFPPWQWVEWGSLVCGVGRGAYYSLPSACILNEAIHNNVMEIELSHWNANHVAGPKQWLDYTIADWRWACVWVCVCVFRCSISNCSAAHASTQFVLEMVSFHFAHRRQKLQPGMGLDNRQKEM